MTIFDNIIDEKLIEEINSGKVGVIPTDTIFGLAAKASNRQAVERLYMLKSREKKPGTIIAGSIDQLVDIGIKRRYLKAVKDYWPNPISVVIPCGLDLNYLHMGVGSIAVRIVNNKKLEALLNKTGSLLTSSANLPGEPESKNINEAVEYFGEKIDYYVDDNIGSINKPSTVIRVVDDALEVLRDGAIKVSEDSGRLV